MDIILSGEESLKGGRRGSFISASRQRSSHSLSSTAETLSPAPVARGEGSAERRAKPEPAPNVGGENLSRGSSSLARSPSCNHTPELQTLEERRVYPIGSDPVSRERSIFAYIRRSSQIRPLLSPIDASARAASDDRSDATVGLVDPR